ncbi:phage regulatory CII family protein [Salmonella enterica]
MFDYQTSKHAHFDAACRAFAIEHNLEDVAAAVGMRPQILRNKLNPAQPHRLTCDELLAITDYTEDARLLDGMLGQINCLPSVPVNNATEANMQLCALSATASVGAIAGEAVSTGHMTAARRTQILDRARDANAGSPEQAAISELVLRAGNGSPVGITATLWRRSPAAANEVAWVNTSGDTYDIYINIGQYAYWLIAQYDYTGNANVTLHSTPEYSSVQPGNSTSGQTYTIYSSLMKPTAGDVGALPITGGQLNGPLGIGTDNALGGNSIVFGDNDTGFKWHSDGVLGIYANNALVGYIDNSGLHMSVDVITNGGIRAGDGKRLSLTSNNNSTMTATFNLWGDANRPTVIELDDDQGWHLYSQRNPDGSIVFTVNGDITANTLRAGGAIYQNNGDIFGSLWGNGWLSTWINNNLVLDVQLGAGTSVTTWNNAGSWPNTPGYVVTSVWKDYQGENIDGINYAPLQKRVGSQWYTVQGGTV